MRHQTTWSNGTQPIAIRATLRRHSKGILGYTRKLSEERYAPCGDGIFDTDVRGGYISLLWGHRSFAYSLGRIYVYFGHTCGALYIIQTWWPVLCTRTGTKQCT